MQGNLANGAVLNPGTEWWRDEVRMGNSGRICNSKKKKGLQEEKYDGVGNDLV